MSAVPCRLVLLGQPRVQRAGAPDHLLERRDAALLAALALQGPLPRDQAIACLWPQAERKAGQNNLRQRLFRLKQIAGQELVSSDAVLTLAPGVDTDIHHFGERLAAGDPGDDVLLATLDYGDGAALADLVDRLRERWHGRRQDLLLTAADAHQQQGRTQAALHCIERLLQHDPCAESAHRQRMRLHYLRGERVAALVAWADCVTALRDHADAQPDEQTRELAALIERSGVLPGSGTAATAAPLPAALLRPPRLVGRGEAWQVLQTAWRDGQALVVRGEPGIGKSRLLGDFAQAHDGVALHGARPGDSELPYTLLQRMLRAFVEHGLSMAPWVRSEVARLLPELGEAAAGRLEPIRLQRAVVDLLVQARVQGLRVLVVDDFQFADAASQELLLGGLAQPAPELPLPWLAVRPGEMPMRLTDWLDKSAQAGVTELTLPPLTPTQVDAFIASVGLPAASAAVWAPALLQRTGGNPLFMLLALQSAHGGGADEMALDSATFAIPTSVGRLIEQRLRLLGAPAMRLARVAALAGQDFSLELAAEVLKVHAVDLSDGLMALQQAQLMLSDRFAFDLVAEVVRAAVPDTLAQLLQRGIAQALAARGAPAARVAAHWQLGHAWHEAAVAFELAASQARRAARKVDEVRWEDEAATCYRHAGAAVAAWHARVRAARTAISAEPAEQAVARIQRLTDEAVDPPARLDSLLLHALQKLTVGDPAAAHPAREALTLARVLLDRDRELQAANSLGIALALSGQAADGLTLLEQVLPLVQMQADGESKQAFYSHYGYVLGALGRFREAAAAVQQAADLALAMGDLDSASTEEGNLAAMLGFLGDRVGALQAVERALDCWRLMGEPAGVASAANHMRAGIFYTLAGRYREALAAHTQALQMFRAGQAALWASFTEHQLARVWLELGQPARALQTLTPLAPAPSAQVHNMRLMVQASIRLQLGRPDPQALRQGLTDDAALMTIEWSGGQLMLAALLPAEEGLVICEQLQARSLGRHPTVVQHARVRQADCLRRLGRVAEAAELAQEALAAPDPTSAVWMSVPEFLWLAAQALEAGGQQAHAKRTVAQAADWLRVAQAQVPPAFVESFRDRNPTHRALLLRAAALQA